jgi:hypothetical protein
MCDFFLTHLSKVRKPKKPKKKDKEEFFQKNKRFSTNIWISEKVELFSVCMRAQKVDVFVLIDESAGQSYERPHNNHHLFHAK